MSNLIPISQELLSDASGYLYTADRYHFVRASRQIFKTTIGLLYRNITLISPDSNKGLRLLQSVIDPEKSYRILNLRTLRTGGTSPEDPSSLPLGLEGSELVEAVLRQCLPPIPPNNQPHDSSQEIRDKVVSAYRLCRAGLNASTGTGPTAVALVTTIAVNIESIEWLMVGSGPEATPLQLIRAIIDARTACGQQIYPTLRNLEWHTAWRDTHVPVVPSLKRLVVHGESDQAVKFDLTAMANNSKGQLEELVLMRGDMLTGLERLLASDHLLHLRILRMRNFSREHTTSYRYLQQLLCTKSPRLETLEWDYDYTIFDEPGQPSTPPNFQPKLRELIGIRNAKIHSQLLSPNPSNMDLVAMYKMLPKNLEYLMLVGLGMGAIIQLDDDESEVEETDGEEGEEGEDEGEEGEDEGEEGEDEEGEDEEGEDEEKAEREDDMPDVGEADDRAAQKDPFFLHQLCSRLPSLRRVGFRFDFHANSPSELDQTLQAADTALRRLVTTGEGLGVSLGVYLSCMDGGDGSDLFHMGIDVQAESGC